MHAADNLQLALFTFTGCAEHYFVTRLFGGILDPADQCAKERVVQFRHNGCNETALPLSEFGSDGVGPIPKFGNRSHHTVNIRLLHSCNAVQ